MLCVCVLCVSLADSITVPCSYNCTIPSHSIVIVAQQQLPSNHILVFSILAEYPQWRFTLQFAEVQKVAETQGRVKGWRKGLGMEETEMDACIS